jgi:hypothetical protein
MGNIKLEDLKGIIEQLRNSPLSIKLIDEAVNLFFP